MIFCQSAYEESLKSELTEIFAGIENFELLKNRTYLAKKFDVYHTLVTNHLNLSLDDENDAFWYLWIGEDFKVDQRLEQVISMDTLTAEEINNDCTIDESGWSFAIIIDESNGHVLFIEDEHLDQLLAIDNYLEKL